MGQALARPSLARPVSTAEQGLATGRAAAHGLRAAAAGSSGGAPAAPEAAAPALTREELLQRQAAYFARNIKAIRQSISPRVEAQLARVAAAAPGLGPGARVLDVGAGEGVLVPHLLASCCVLWKQRACAWLAACSALGVQDILAVDVCPEMLEELQRQVGGAPSTLGNEPGVRTWVGDVLDLPAYQGPFDAAFFNSVFGNLHDPHEALLRTALLLLPGGRMVISHPLGREWLEQYRAVQPDIVPHTLPSLEELRQLVFDLPLEVPKGYAHPAAPIYLEGDVTTGFGRGSKQLGVPTANLPPEPLKPTLKQLPSGVFFGWAQLEAEPGSPADDGAVHAMVANIGRRPTFEDATPELTGALEVHVLHRYAADFYGRRLRAVALGYVRRGGQPAAGVRALARGRVAKAQLVLPRWQAVKRELEAGRWPGQAS
eukprot:scaffold9.g3181.t1